MSKRVATRAPAKRMPTHYQILQVHPAAPLDLITAAYWRLVSQVHSTGRSDKAAEVAVYHLTRSYQALANHQSRAEYDNTLGLPAQPSAPPIPPHRRASWVSAFLSAGAVRADRDAEVDYYELLRVDPLANSGIAAEAYLVMRNYYLRLIEQTGVSRDLIGLLAEGYEIVADPAKRLEYDRIRKAKRPARRSATGAAASATAEKDASRVNGRPASQKVGAKNAEKPATKPVRSKRAVQGVNGHVRAADRPVESEEAPGVFEPVTVRLVRSLASFANKASQTLRDVLVDDDPEIPVSIIDLTPQEEEALLARLSSFPDIGLPSETKPEGSGVLARLSILEGPGLGRAFEVESIPFTVGEDDACDITLPGLALQQARLLHRNGQFVLFSLTDEPKTSIHGDSVAWAVLESGDSFEMGPYVMKFESASVPAGAS